MPAGLTPVGRVGVALDGCAERGDDAADSDFVFAVRFGTVCDDAESRSDMPEPEPADVEGIRGRR